MQGCKKCGVEFTGARVRCPLCQGEVSGTGDPKSEVFPVLPDHTGQYNLIIRLLVFLSVASVVICVAIGAMLPNPAVWPWYVAAAVLCMWLCLANVLWRRHNLPKNILWMVFWLSLLSFCWDYFTGFHRWSLDYVIPLICVAAMGAVAVISRVLGLVLEEYLIYLILDGLFGIVPLLFLACGWVSVTYPSIICVASSVLSLAALLVFQWDFLIGEVRRRLHL